MFTGLVYQGWWAGGGGGRYDQVGNRFWGDNTWRDAAYSTTGNLFGFEEKGTNEVFAEAYRERLKKVAGFKYVPEPVPMKTKNGSTIYYLYFASPNPVGAKIVEHIFDGYRKGALR